MDIMAERSVLFEKKPAIFHNRKGKETRKAYSKEKILIQIFCLGCLRNEMFILASICTTSQSRIKCIKNGQ